MLDQNILNELGLHMKKGFKISYFNDYSEIAGILKINALFDFKNNEYILSSSITKKTKTSVYIKDEINVKIQIPDEGWSWKIWEIGGRIPRTPEYHVNFPDGSLCLFLPEDVLIYQEAKLGNYFEKYISKLLIPYVFDVLYYIKCNKWIRGEYAHGELAYLQYLRKNWYDDRYNNIALLDLCLERLKMSKDWIYYYDYIYNDVVSVYLITKINKSVNSEVLIDAIELLKKNVTNRYQKFSCLKFEDILGKILNT